MFTQRLAINHVHFHMIFGATPASEQVIRIGNILLRRFQMPLLLQHLWERIVETKLSVTLISGKELQMRVYILCTFVNVF